MAQIILVHGINNEMNTARQIETDWRHAIEKGLRKRNKKLPPSTKFVTPYYGQLLADEADNWTKTVKEVQSIGLESQTNGSSSDRILAGVSPAIEFLRQYQDLAEISDAELNATLDVLRARGEIHDRKVLDVLFKELVAALAANFPDGYTSFARAFLGQGGAYMQKEGLPDLIERRVQDQIAKIDPDSIVVGHSLGTVVMYRLMRSLPENQQPKLFLSLGSPLGSKPFQDAIGGNISCLGSKTRWLNIADRSDFVALEETLNLDTFGCDKIDNETVQNWFNAHSIEKYLRQKKTADAIIDALGV